MRKALFILTLFTLFAFCSCNKDKIILEIVSPKDGATFTKGQNIEVVVTASTKKGNIIQVQMEVDTIIKSLTTPPYNFNIPSGSFTNTGLFPLSVMAYSSKRVKEGAAIYIKITE